MGNEDRTRSADGSGAATRRVAVGLFLGAPTVVALAACGAGGGQGTSGGQGGEAQLKEPVTLDFQHRWEGSRELLVKQQVEEFAKLQPNVRIANQLVFGSGEGYLDGMPYDKILTQIAAGTGPDVFMVGSTQAMDFASKSGLRDVTPLARRDKIELTRAFIPATIQMSTYKNAVVGLPQLGPDGGGAFLFYSHEAWQAAGLDTSKPPTSWDELVSFSQRLTKAGDGPGGFERAGLVFPGPSFQAWATRNNTKILSDDGKKVLFNTPEGIDTIEWMHRSTMQLFGSWDNRQAYANGVRGAGPAAARVPQYTNKIGIWITGVWHFFEAANEAAQYNPQFKYGVALAPANGKNPQAKPLALSEKVWLYAVTAGSKKVDAAWEWTKFVTMGDGNRLMTVTQRQPSGAVKINEDPAFTRDNPHWNTVVKQALENTVSLPQTAAWSQIASATGNPLGKLTNDVMSGAKAPREALAEAAREAQLLLDRANGL